MKFTKTFNIEYDTNEYTSGNYVIYRGRTFKNNGSCKCDGNWIVQIDGKIDDSFRTLREAKNYCLIDSIL